MKKIYLKGASLFVLGMSLFSIAYGMDEDLVRSDHVYGRLNPLYKTRDNFLHAFLDNINLDLNGKRPGERREITGRPRVFFSHAYDTVPAVSEGNKNLILLIGKYLGDLTIPFRTDIRDYRVGDCWDRMEKDVDWADVVVIIYTKTYEAKTEVLTTGVYKEWSHAKSTHKRMIYLVMEDGINAAQHGLFYLDFKNPDLFHEKMFTLMRSLFKEDSIPIDPYEETMRRFATALGRPTDLRLLETGSRSASDLIRSGIECFNRRELGDAERDFSQALEIQQKAIQEHIRSLNWLAVVLEKKGNFEGAKYSFQQTLELDSTNIHALYGLGRVFLGKGGDIAESKKKYKKALAEESTYPQAFHERDVSNVTPSEAAEALEAPETRAKSSFLDPLTEITVQDGLRFEWLDAESPDQIRTSFEQNLQANPESITALNGLATVWRESDLDLSEAYRTLASDPKNIEALNNLGDVWFYKGDINKAKDYYEQILVINPGCAYALKNLGNVWSRKRDFTKAKDYYNRSLVIVKEGHLALTGLGDVYTAEGNLAEARSYYEQARTVLPTYTPAVTGLGDVCFWERDYNGAQAYYEKAFAMYPEYGPALNGLAAVWREKQDLDLSEAYRALAQAPKNVEALNNLGSIWFDRGDLTKAQSCYEGALGLDQRNVVTLTNLSLVYFTNGELERAQVCYKQALDVDCTYAPAHNGLGVILKRLGELGEALAQYKEAVEKDEAYVPALINMGNISDQVGDLKKAEEHYEKALKLNPQQEEALMGLGVIAIKEGKLESAQRYCERALQVNPSHGGAFNNLGISFYKQGQQSLAIEQFKKAAQAEDTVAAVANVNLGNMYLNEGKLDQANVYYQQAELKDPTLSIASESLGLLHMEQEIPFFDINQTLLSVSHNPLEIKKEEDLDFKGLEVLKKEEEVNNPAASCEAFKRRALKTFLTKQASRNQTRERLKQAQTCYEQALSLDPKNLGLLNNLSIVLEEKGEDEHFSLFLVQQGLNQSEEEIFFKNMTDLQMENFLKDLDWSKLSLSQQQCLLDKNLYMFSSIESDVSTTGFTQNLSAAVKAIQSPRISLTQSPRISLTVELQDLMFTSDFIFTDEDLDFITAVQGYLKNIILTHCQGIEDSVLRFKSPNLVLKDWMSMTDFVRFYIKGAILNYKYGMDTEGILDMDAFIHNCNLLIILEKIEHRSACKKLGIPPKM